MEEIQVKTKYCKFCGEKIHEDAVVCTQCGRQVEKMDSNTPNVVINNTNTNMNTNTQQVTGRQKNKWVSLVLCIFTICGHKFYEGKIGMGIVYFFTAGFFGIGWIIDIIALLLKPNPYYV